MMWLAFGLGLLLGTVAGIFVIGLLHIGARSKEYEGFLIEVPTGLSH